MSKIWLCVHIEDDILDDLVDHILEKFPRITEDDITIDDFIEEELVNKPTL